MARLTLSRRVGERLRILVPAGGEREVWVQLVDVDRGRARLSVGADRDVIVDREEVLEARRAQGGEGEKAKDVRGEP